MKKHLLFCVIAFLAGGCLHHSPYLYDHEITIALKDDVPCFGLADDEQIFGEQFNIFIVSISHNVADQFPKLVMSKDMKGNTLQSGECIPYGGTALESNVLYGINIGGYFIKQRSGERHNYAGAFCFSENKNGEKILHHFKTGEYPASCPVSSDE
ncbi:MAG: hypothetical protein LBU76_06855 [Azoarcus sp.]|jgi:hypothetical protein|nr:hypothetical protein [Azoarcus sp.]